MNFKISSTNGTFRRSLKTTNAYINYYKNNNDNTTNQEIVKKYNNPRTVHISQVTHVKEYNYRFILYCKGVHSIKTNERREKIHIAQGKQYVNCAFLKSFQLVDIL